MSGNEFLDYKGLGYFYEKLKTDPFFTAGGDPSIPPGLIAMWSGTTVPEGWVLCNGENNTPDLSDKFIVGTTDLEENGEAVTLTEAGSLFTAGEQISFYKLAFIMKVDDGNNKAVVYKAGDGISIDEDVISVINPINGIITQSDYELLSDEKKNKGVWFVVDDDKATTSNSSKLDSVTSRPSFEQSDFSSLDSSFTYAPGSDAVTGDAFL